MSEPSIPATFGRTPRKALQGALALLLVLSLGWLVVERMLTRPGGPTARFLAQQGLPDWLILAAGLALAVVITALGTREYLRTGVRFTLQEEGLRIEDGLGSYLVEWNNLAGVGVSRVHALLLRVRDQDRLLATHRGTDQQRTLLAKRRSVDGWDMVFLRSEVGLPTPEVAAWLRRRAGLPAEPDGESASDCRGGPGVTETAARS